MFINPYQVSMKEDEVVNLDEKITEVIEMLLQKKPGAVLEASKESQSLLADIQTIIFLNCIAKTAKKVYNKTS